LEVYKKLREIGVATSDHEAQEELLAEARHIVQEICDDHVAAADNFVRDSQLSSLLKAGIEVECQLLVDYLEAARRFNLEINSRAKDRVVSFGEKLCCRFMTCLLKDRVSFLSSVRLLLTHADARGERGWKPNTLTWLISCTTRVRAALTLHSTRMYPRLSARRSCPVRTGYLWSPAFLATSPAAS
jgi:hypothetical protein